MPTPSVAPAPRLGQWPPLGRWLWELAAWSIVFFGLSRFGLGFLRMDNTVLAVQPGAGIAMAVLLWRGYRIWPSLIFGALLARASAGLLSAENVALTMGGSLIALWGAWLVRRFVGPRLDFRSITQVLRFLWWGAVVRSLAGAIWAVGFQVVTDRIAPDRALLAFSMWFAGSAMGVAVFAPFLLSWVQPPRRGDGEATARETTALFSLLALVTMADYLTIIPLSFLPFPLLVWAGMRLDLRALTTAIVIMVMVTLASGAAGLAAFGLPVPASDSDVENFEDETMVALQVFVLCEAGTALSLGAIAASRRHALLDTSELAAFRKAVLDGSNLGIIVADNTPRTTSVNRGATRMLGYSEAELMQLIPTTWHDPAELAAAARDLEEKTGEKVEGVGIFTHLPRVGKLYEHEWTITRKDGSKFPALVTVSPLRTADGVRMGYMGVMVDITARKEAERQMRAAQRTAEDASRAKSEFLANMSHEIRTPMNAILGFADQLQRSTDDPDLQKQARAIAAGGRTLLQLLNDVLDLAKVEAGRVELQMEQVRLPETMEEVRALFAAPALAKGLDLAVESHGLDDGSLLLDGTRLRQILFNLVGNALKFTARGRVVLAAEAMPLPDGARAIQLEVRDTGVGVRPEEIERIFEPFGQATGQDNRKYGGTGLGLSICRRLAELMGGTLEAVSYPGAGSIFRLRLPRVEWIPGVGQTTSFPAVPAQFRVASYLDASDDEALSPAARAACAACLVLAEGPWRTQWEHLHGAPLSDEVEDFGALLARGANGTAPDFLRDYGRRLAAHAHDFEIEAMTRLLDDFPACTARLRRAAAPSVVAVF